MFNNYTLKSDLHNIIKLYYIIAEIKICMQILIHNRYNQ